MKLSNRSVEILKESEKPSFFNIDLSNDTIHITGVTNKPEGNLLVFADDVETAVDQVYGNIDKLDWVIFVDNSFKAHVIAKPSYSYKEETEVSIDSIFRKVFSSKGFQKREEQLKMAKFIYECLVNNYAGIVEAPTGTGKSLSYLIPAVMFSKNYLKRVVISTNTINLQRQLIEKEIPFLKQFVNFNVEIAIGRNNYICKRKVETLLNKGSLFLFEDDSYKEIKEFIYSAIDGTKNEFFSKKRNLKEEYWGLFESSSLTCARSSCPYYKNNECFFYKARNRLEKADIIIANHHIVFSDSLIEFASILPEFDTLIFDEAHNIEKSATSYYTKTISSREILNILDMLYSNKKGKLKGLLSEDEDKNLIRELINAKNEIKSTFETLSNKINGELKIDNDSFEEIHGHLRDLINLIDSLLTKLKEMTNNTEKNNEDIKSIITTLSYNRELLLEFSNWSKNKSDKIFWISSTGQHVNFNITPTYVKEAIKEHLYSKLDSIIFISATLTVNNNFDFFKETVGIKEAKELMINTTFDYKKNSRLIMVEDIPSPNSKYFIQSVSKILTEIATTLDGKRGVLVLFTSYKMLNNAHKKSKAVLQKKGFNVLKQGDLDNFELLKEFKKGRSFLFATNSFWEGIDVKGEELSILIIVRLPFEVPTTSIESARLEMLKNEGKDAFLEYSLPKAVLRFKQGLGRLIRDKNDTGLMIVLDTRILKKSYGKIFLNSVNYMKKERVKLDEIQKVVSNFFSGFDN